MSKRESRFKRQFLNKIKTVFPDVCILDINPINNRSHPDVVMIFGDKYYVLEFKRSKSAPKRPNQEYYINKIYYSDFIYPENADAVFERVYNVFSIARGNE